MKIELNKKENRIIIIKPINYSDVISELIAKNKLNKSSTLIVSNSENTKTWKEKFSDIAAITYDETKNFDFSKYSMVILSDASHVFNKTLEDLLKIKKLSIIIASQSIENVGQFFGELNKMVMFTIYKLSDKDI